MKVTFTEEAVAGMAPEKLGEIIRDRVARGARTFEVVSLDQAIGRLAAIGVPVIGDLPVVEVESRYPAPTPEEIDELLAEIAGCGYASQTCEVVEEWMHRRYGVRGAMTTAELEEIALHNVEEVAADREKVARRLVRHFLEGTARVDPVGLEPGTTETVRLFGEEYAIAREADDGR